MKTRISIFVAILLAACAVSGVRSPLAGAEWVVEDINGGGVIDSSRASLLFGADGTVSGSGSCNLYGARYTVKGARLTITNPAATLVACVPALMDQERKFFDALSNVSSYLIDETGALVLTAPDGRGILARR